MEHHAPHCAPAGDSVEAITGYAEKLLEQGAFNEALATAEPILLRAPFDAWVIAAAAAFADGQAGRATSLYDRARALFSDPSIEDPSRRGLQEHLETRLSAWRLLCKLAGGEPPMANADPADLLAKGEEAFYAGATDEASAAFLCALALRPGWPEAWLDLGVTLLRAGAAEPAEECMRACIALDPGEPDGWVGMAEMLRRQGRTGQAASLLRDRLAEAPTDEGALEVLRQMGVQGERPPTLLLAGTSVLDAPVWNAHCADLGMLASCAHAELLGALTLLRGERKAALDEVIRRAQPVAVVATGPQADEWRDVCSEHGLPLLDGAPDPSVLAPLAQARPSESAALPPLLSVIVPTFERHRCVLNLLDRIALQDLPPSYVEVVVVDDGSATELLEAIGPQDRAYGLDLVRQEGRGPAAARNTALTRCQAPWVVIYNDDTVPDLDNLRRHLCAQVTATATGTPEAVLGTFDFPEDRCQTLFMHLLQTSTRLFLYPWMRPGELHSWLYLFSCNISLPRQALEAVGGFDSDHFPHAICEDTELGIRLVRELGVQVRFRPEIRAWHDHFLDVDGYARRAFRLGYYQHRIWELHKAREVMWAAGEEDPESDQTWLKIRAVVEEARRTFGDVMKDARHLATLPVPSDIQQRGEILQFLDRVVGYILGVETRRGHIYAREGWSDDPTPVEPCLADKLTSIIMPNLNGGEHVRTAIESLRRTTSGPVELIVVDNGSTDDSLEWLRGQDDIVLVELGENLGAPVARNRGLELAHGETILFCDNDVIFTPRWRELLLWHLEQWPDVGMVAPMSDVVVGPQKVPDPPAPDADLDAWAEQFTEENLGRHDYRGRLILLCLVVRREVIDQIGGIDEAFSPWGFEDDDFTVRAAVAGYRLRIAGDCFVRHLGSRTAVSAGLDYGALLHANWETFKARWGMDPDIPYGEPYDSRALAQRPFEPDVHHVRIEVFERGPLVQLKTIS